MAKFFRVAVFELEAVDSDTADQVLADGIAEIEQGLISGVSLLLTGNPDSAVVTKFMRDIGELKLSKGIVNAITSIQSS